MNRLERICATVVITAMGLCACHAAGVQPMATLTIKPDWPVGMKGGRRIGVLLMSSALPGKHVQTATPTADGEYVFGNLPPGDYVFESRESQLAAYGIEIAGKIRIAKGDRRVMVKPAVNPVKLVTVKVTASSGGASIDGELKYWRNKSNAHGLMVRPEGSKQKFIAGRKYFFRMVPYSCRAEKVLVGPLDPADLVKTGLNFKIKVEKPTIAVRWAIRDVDVKLLPKRARVHLLLYRLKPDGMRQRVEGLGIDYTSWADPGKGVEKLTKMYGLPNGSYELTGKIVGSSSFKTDVLVAKAPVQFKVTDGKATPAEVKLDFSSEMTGTFSVTVLDRNGNRLPKAYVGFSHKIGGSLWHSKTDGKGTVVTPRLACDSYKIVVGVDKMPLLHKQVVLQPGANHVTMGFTDVVDVRLRILDRHGKPAQTEGSYVPGCVLSRKGGFGNPKGRHTIRLQKDDFPLLVYAYILNNKEKPEFVSAMLNAPPSKEIVLRVPALSARKIMVRFPAKWIEKERAGYRLWFTPKGKLAPSAEFRLRSSSKWKTTVASRTDTEIALQGEIRLSEGTYEVLLLKTSRGSNTVSWLGSVAVPKEGQIDLPLSDKLIKATQKASADLRKVIQEKSKQD